ncbi:hypothetical protein GCM10025859_10830 [Alicyclobacillus fastidiosus]|nr:hypothetical protein GCM10025859_10830 [Alicyclobacillus fastidiosus]
MPARLLPDIAQPGNVLGVIRDHELLQTGQLATTRVVHTASHDTAAAVVSVPASEQNYVYISSGTWSLMGTVVNEPVIGDLTDKFNFTNEGGLGNYRLLKNVMGLWLIQEVQRALEALGEASDILRLVHRARMAAPFPYMFDPDDPRLLQVGNIPDTIRQICVETGQRPPADSGSLVRGIFESLALKYRMVLDQLELVTGQHYGAIHIVGGGSQNQLLSQFAANATDRMVITGPVEASATGNALVQLLAIGEVAGIEELTQLVRQSVEPVSYLPRDTDVWAGGYDAFQRIVAKQAAAHNLTI